MAIESWSKTAANNVDGTIGTEGMAGTDAPSTIDGSYREALAQVRRWAEQVVHNVHCDTVGGTGDVITATPDIAPAAYTTGAMYTFVAGSANTGATTININSLGAKSIVKLNDQALAADDIEAGQVVILVYDGTSMQMLNPAANSSASGLQNIVEDTMPQLGGDLDAFTNSANIDMANATSIRDGNQNEVIEVGQTAAAVNHVKITNAASSFDPLIQPNGDDTNVALLLKGLGTDPVKIGDVELGFPDADGSAGQPIITDGAATLSIGEVKTAGIEDNAVSLAKVAHHSAAGVLGYGASGVPSAISADTSGYVLTDNGTGAAPTFQPSGGVADDSITLAKLEHKTDLNPGILGYATSGVPSFIEEGTSGHPLVSAGTAAAPSFGQVDTAGIADDAITLAKLNAGTAGELFTWNASGDPAALAVGTSGDVLTSNGAGSVPTYQTPTTGTDGLGGDFFSTNEENESVSASTTATAVITELDDPNGDYAAGTGIYTASTAGTYVAWAQIALPTTGTGTHTVGIAKNGTTILQSYSETADASLRSLSITNSFILAATDTLRLRITNADAGSRTFAVQWGAFRIGP